MADVISSSRVDDIDADSLATALEWFDISESDRVAARDLAETADEVASSIIESFYDHLLSHPYAAQHFEDERQIEQVKQAQIRYFKELVQAELTEEYVEDRRRIGSVHERIGVTPTLYVGAYSFYLSRLSHVILEQMADDPERSFRSTLALIKIAHFDMAQALETYVSSREETIQSRERELSELPTPVLQLRPGLLLVPVVGNLDSFRARALTVHMLERIRDLRAQAIVLDITGVSDVDSAVANHLLQAMTAARLMGANSVLTGISAEVARSLVKIGVSAEELNTAGDLEQGIELAERIMRK